MNRTSKKIDKAFEYAKNLHDNKTAPTAETNFDYLLCVYDHCRSENEKIVALLSGTLALGGTDPSDLFFQFGPTVRDAVIALTHQPNEDEDTFIDRVKTNPISRAVKVAELKMKLEKGIINEVEFDNGIDRLIS